MAKARGYPSERNLTRCSSGAARSSQELLMTRFALLPVVLLFACGAPQSDSPPPSELQRQSEFVGKVWMSTDTSAAPGTVRIFLPDGTLLMDSCGETYRLARWRAIDNRRIEWTEDAARIEAQIARLTEEDFRLRLQLAEGVKFPVPWGARV
ncbi:MAG: hypothetical protein ABIP65_03855 [Vicinamibacterales bacterium]